MVLPINIRDIDSTTQFSQEVEALVYEARGFLEKHDWCKEVWDGWLFTNIGYALCIFLFKVDNVESKEDGLVWVVVEDLPPMYLDTFSVRTTTEVIEAYIFLASEWVEKVEAKRSISECCPLEASQTQESVEMLKCRIKLLETNMLPNIDNVDYEAIKKYL